MKKIFIVLTFSALFLSCGQDRESPQEKVEKPKALEDKGISLSDVSKRVATDILDDLYAGIVDSSKALKSLETDISEFQSKSPDALSALTEFDSKNREYFKSAQNHLDLVNDSSLRNEISNILQAELSNYELSVSDANDRKKALISKIVPISDLRTSLKVLLTLKVMAKYQKANVPDKKPIEREIIKADTLISKLKQQIRKSK